ncbi:MAG: FHA domain-containing protein [Gemmataceae bacterium]|nr:FHA domain-containing protein [Gemmataceae bacterium]MCS7271337.1 FHA domain-containing protein [Gemmataceae bacterium]MDW8243865.1 FHA domain-containing protein [Thermogemmata sp.]
MRAVLIPLDGGSPIELTKELVLLGRDEECDIRFEQKSVSKLHCVIVKSDGVLLLRDLGSTNGTRVNGQRVRRAALLPNDILALANVKFRVHYGPETASPAVAVAPPSDRTLEESDQTVAPISPNPLPDVYPPDASGAGSGSVAPPVPRPPGS